VANDETVRTASKDIVQFRYGEDGIFPARTTGGSLANFKEEIRKLKNKGKEAKE
jgi:hypothetical protein